MLKENKKSVSSDLYEYDCNFCVRNYANMKHNALCCSKQDRSELYGVQKTFFVLFRPFFILLPPGLASSFPADQNFSKGASFSNSPSWPLKNMCQHIFHQITTPPWSNRSVYRDTAGYIAILPRYK